MFDHMKTFYDRRRLYRPLDLIGPNTFLKKKLPIPLSHP